LVSDNQQLATDNCEGGFALDSQHPPDHDTGVTPVPPPPPPPADGGGAPDEPIDDAQLSPRAWLARNGTTLLLVAAALVFVWYKFGPEGTWTIAKVILGIGAVIFVHELGHFLVAKWCDVHVQTFSIGFGPALPGCIYKWGETTYKVALFPLGGYVKMVGEGGENDEEDTDPRSYKNKSVGQRMAIISAGVVMNIIFGLVVFIVAFKIGVHQTAPVVGVEETGGPAWQAGVRPGDQFTKVDNVARPHFEDLRAAVMLCDARQRVRFEFEGKDAVEIEPRKTKSEKKPIIGINPPMELKLPEKGDADSAAGPVLRDSAAAAARALDLRPGDRVLTVLDARDTAAALLAAATTPCSPLAAAGTVAIADQAKHLPAPPAGQPFDFGAFAERLRRAEGEPVLITVRRAGRDEDDELVVEPTGFQFGDAIVGTSDPEATNPFQTAPLEKDPRDPQGRHLDYFQFLDRLSRMADRPVVIQVRRKATKGASDDSAPVNVLVPPAYHRVLPGVRMTMGAVTALRDGSSAKAHGVKEGDVITAVTLSAGAGSVTFATNPGPGEKQLDPLRLPYDLRQWATGRAGVKATLKVRRLKDINPDATEQLTGLPWQESGRDDLTIPMGVTSSLSLSELGIAYQVKAQIDHVDPDSPAKEQGLRAEDFILAWNFQRSPRKAGQSPKWLDKPVNLRLDDAQSGDPEPRWASVFYQMQSLEYDRVRLTVRHKDLEEETVELDLQRDPTWPLLDPNFPRGLALMTYQDRIVQADNIGDAVHMGLRYTWRTIAQIYMSIKALVTQRVSAADNLQGPIDIAVFAYSTAGHGWADFLLLLGLISLNLAVVNFLPIPILDGGHMVFLIYEALRGKPASEHVRLAANWLGLLVLLSLMGFVLYLGFSRWIWPLIEQWWHA
jgi:membrane-associated protease RseP (regulator of RpoE activity)